MTEEMYDCKYCKRSITAERGETRRRRKKIKTLTFSCECGAYDCYEGGIKVVSFPPLEEPYSPYEDKITSVHNALEEMRAGI